MTRLGRMSLAVLTVSALLGGLFGARVAAGASRLNDHLRLYTAMLDAVEQNYAEEVKSERLVSSSIREMLRTLDPHSNFLEVKEYSQLQERQHGSYFGLGLTLVSENGNLTVVGLFEGTPAHRLGIRTGDVIGRIDGEDAHGMDIDVAVRKLKGPKGTAVKVGVNRQGYDKPLEFTVIRDEIILHAVPFSFMVSKTVGYIRLTDFNEITACRPGEGPGCERELEKALRVLSKAGARAIVLDVRDNPGGLLDQALAVSSMFLKKGQLVVFTKGRSKRDESSYSTETDGSYSDLPVVLLTSKRSASATEIVAGAVQDHDRGLIVGEVTFGKGLVQTIMPLRNLRGYALALTTARYYTPSGRSIQRDYGSTNYFDYVDGANRRTCADVAGEPRLTDTGRKVYGGNGIKPDYCIDPPAPTKFVSYLASRQAFLGFSGRYAATESAGNTEISGTGTRSGVTSAEVHLIGRDFEATDAVLADFKAYLTSRKLRFTDKDLEDNKEALRHLIVEEMLRQVFSEQEAKKRALTWDPQMRKALEVVPQAAELISHPAGVKAAAN